MPADGPLEADTHRMLRKCLLENFAIEVEQLKDAAFVELGSLVQKVLDRLYQEGAINVDRVIGAMLHPSAICTYRINYLIDDRSVPVLLATSLVPCDQARRAFRGRFLEERFPHD